MDTFIAEHWSAVQVFISTVAGLMIAAFGYCARKGGRPALAKWSDEIERETRTEVLNKIACALSAMNTTGEGSHSACDEFIACLDRWRDLQERKRTRTRAIGRIHKLVIFALIGAGIAFGSWYLIEKKSHLYTLCGVALVVVVIVVATYDWLPMFLIAYHRGMLPGKGTGTD